MTKRLWAGGRITAVAPGPAACAGLKAGDVVQAVNSMPVHDVLDWWWLTAEALCVVSFVRDSTHMTCMIENEAGEPLGVSFEDVVFDGVRLCANACTFCFVAGLPRGLRPSLYVRDDDYRLSFLNGNFVTLTNMTSKDVERIITQRLSPLHVSVHATDPGIRRVLMRPVGEDRALAILDELLCGGIQAHVQIVLVRGVNDGAVLDQTLAYLKRRPNVVSVGVVPMGYTRHRRRPAHCWTPEVACGVIQQLNDWQAAERAVREVAWVYPADEFYLLAGVPVPDASLYDGFSQYENGIGMVSAFIEEFRAAAARAQRGVSGPRRWRVAGRTMALTLVTGELFAPVLQMLLDQSGLPAVRVLPVQNRLLGGNVSVAGLLGGHDIADAIVTDGAQGRYLVPDVVVNSDGLLLDDVAATSLTRLTKADVRIVGRDAESLVNALLE